MTLMNTQVAESIQNILPQLLSESLQKSGLTRGVVEASRDDRDDEASRERPAKRPKSTESYNEPQVDEVVVFTMSQTRLPYQMISEFLTSTFRKHLSKEVWTELLDKYQ